MPEADPQDVLKVLVTPEKWLGYCSAPAAAGGAVSLSAEQDLGAILQLLRVGFHSPSCLLGLLQQADMGKKGCRGPRRRCLNRPVRHLRNAAAGNTCSSSASINEMQDVWICWRRFRTCSRRTSPAHIALRPGSTASPLWPGTAGRGFRRFERLIASRKSGSCPHRVL